MRKTFILFGLLISLSVFGYGHPAHKRITAKLPDILRAKGFESAAHFIWDAIYNKDLISYPSIEDPIGSNKLVNWDDSIRPDTIPVFRTQVVDIDWNLWDLFPWELAPDLLAAIADFAFSHLDYKKGDTLMFWTSKQGAFPCLYDTVYMVDKYNYIDRGHTKNLTESSVWPDFRTFFDNDPDTIYRGNDIIGHTYIRGVTTGKYHAGYAHLRLNEHFNFAVQCWEAGDTVQALRWLGRGLHYIQDVSVPFHSSIPWWGLDGGILTYLIWESWHQQDKFDNFGDDSVSFNEWPYYRSYGGWDTSYVNDDTIEPGQIIKDVSDFARKNFGICDGINPEIWNLFSWGTTVDFMPWAVELSMEMALKSCAEYIMKFFKTVGYIEAPSDLDTTSLLYSNLGLEWTDKSDNETAFKIYI